MIPPAIEIIILPEFDKDVEKLRKAYPLVVSDVRELISQLKSGERPGNQVREAGAVVYKTRLPNRSARRGKSGGFRVYYLVQSTDHTTRITLLIIYSKTDQKDISISALRLLLRSVG